MNKFTKYTVLGTTAIVAGVALIVPVSAQAGADSLAGRVAELLGVSEEQLSEAFKTASIEEIEDRVDEGQIDEDQATEMIARIEESENAFPGLHLGGPGGMMGGRHGFPADVLADFLGMTEDEVTAAREDGQTIDDLLEAAGKTQTEFAEYRHQQAVADVEAKIAAGEIDADEGAEMLANMEEHHQQVLEDIENGVFPGEGQMGGRGQRGMGMMNGEGYNQ